MPLLLLLLLHGAAVVLLAAGALAQGPGASLEQSIIPGGLSDSCTSFLMNVDEDGLFSTCTEPLIDAASLYMKASKKNSTAARTALRSTLDDTCRPSGGCDRALVRQYIAKFWDECADDLETNAGVKDIYDYIYMFVPFRDAVCARDGDEYCVLGLVPQNLRAIKQLQAQRLEALHTQQLALNASDVLVEQAFLFLGPASNASVMCSTCAKEVLAAYVAFEMSAPYALGLDRSEVLGKQHVIFAHAQDVCGDRFVADVGNRAGSGVYTEAALRAGAASLHPSLLYIAAAALAAAFL